MQEKRQHELRSGLFCPADLPLHPRERGRPEPQAWSHHLRLKNVLSVLLPVFFVAVISKRPNNHDLVASSQALGRVVGQWSEGHHSMEDRWQVLVLAGVAVEAFAVDRDVKAGDAAAVALGDPIDRISGQVTHDGGLVHQDSLLQIWRQGYSRSRTPTCA